MRWSFCFPGGYHHVHLIDHLGDRSHFGLGGIYPVILKGRPIPPLDPIPARSPLVAFAVDDLNAVVERLRAQYVELPWGIEQGTDSRWVVLHDPAGNLIELTQFRRWEHTSRDDLDLIVA